MTAQSKFGEWMSLDWLRQRKFPCRALTNHVAHSILYRTRATTEVEPQLTLRGHSAAITRLIHAPSKHILFSASLDSSIRIWALPTQTHTTYAPYDDSRAVGELIGHTDAVWDLALVRDESTLISCGAEGAVKVWNVANGAGSLKLSWLYDGLSDEQEEIASDIEADTLGATAVEAIKTDLKKVAVAYQNTTLKIFDIETGKEMLKLQAEITNGLLSLLCLDHLY
jgi:striatin 1/3/4